MSLLKAVGPPGSPGFLLVALAAGVIVGYVWPRKPRLGRAWVVLVLAVYLALSWPPVARLLVESLPHPTPWPAAERPDALQTLIVFDGDNRRGRVRLTEDILATRPPDTVHVIGSHWILDDMTPALRARIVHDARPGNTREQIEWVGRFLGGHPGPAAIVASRLQAPRVRALLASAGLAVPVLASALDDEPVTGGIWSWLPAYSTLAISRDALYEHAALAYYRWRGWI